MEEKIMRLRYNPRIRCSFLKIQIKLKKIKKYRTNTFKKYK